MTIDELITEAALLDKWFVSTSCHLIRRRRSLSPGHDAIDCPITAVYNQRHSKAEASTAAHRVGLILGLSKNDIETLVIAADNWRRSSMPGLGLDDKKYDEICALRSRMFNEFCIIRPKEERTEQTVNVNH